MSRHEVCRNCAHWARWPDDEVGDLDLPEIGECRAFPPEVRWFGEEKGRWITAAWPSTRAEQWCGEWFPGRAGDE